GSGDEFEIVLATNSDGLDVMRVRMEHATHEAPDPLARALADEIRSRCEVRVTIEVLRPGSLPKTEFKAKRVRDLRYNKSPTGASDAAASHAQSAFHRRAYRQPAPAAGADAGLPRLRRRRDRRRAIPRRAR